MRFDFTIADFVADVRTPTPSVAAEIVSADGEGILKILARQSQQMTRHMGAKVNAAKNHLDWVQKHLLQQHPKRRFIRKDAAARVFMNCLGAVTK